MMGGRCDNCAGEINEGVGEEAGQPLLASTNREADKNRSTQETFKMKQEIQRTNQTK